MKALRGNLHKTISLLLKKSRWCLIKKKSKPNFVKYSVWEWFGVFSLSLGWLFFSWQIHRCLRGPSLSSVRLPQGPVMGTLSYSFSSPMLSESWEEPEDRDLELWKNNKKSLCSSLPPFPHLSIHSFTSIKKKISVGFRVSSNLFFILKFAWYFRKVVSWTPPVMELAMSWGRIGYFGLKSASR